MFGRHRTKGQGLVEFALILPALLLILFAIIEAAFLFQAWLAVQHAAREGTRFAVTMKPDWKCTLEQAQKESRGEDPGECKINETRRQWEYRRSDLIRRYTQGQSMGIRVLHGAVGFFDSHTDVGSTLVRDSNWNNRDEAAFFGVIVTGVSDPPAFANPTEWNDGWSIDYPGLAGYPVRVQVEYNWAPLDPIIGQLMEWIAPPNGVIKLHGESVMVNEGIQAGMSAMAPPIFATATVAAPSGGGTGGGGTLTGVTSTPTNTSTPTSTPTNTPTPTSTPTYEYIILAPERDRWPQAEIPNGTVKIFNHTDATGPYGIWWTDNCGKTTYLGFALTTKGGTAEWKMPDPSQVSASFAYLSAKCGSIVPEQRYSGYLSSRRENGQVEAEQEIGVYEPRKPPDLTVSRIIVPEDLEGGGEFLIQVEVQNTQSAEITHTFEVDIYVDPSYEPVRKGQQGIGTANGGSPKQWLVGMAPNSTRMLSFVIWLPPVGTHTLWAQVDTSDLVDELDDDTNNISGPVELNVPCSDMCDNFGELRLDGKWIYAPVGSAAGGGQMRLQGDELVIYGQGESLWNTYDGRFHMAHQGAFEGKFEMTVLVMEYARQATDAQTGLMVRESLAAGDRYIAISVRNHSAGPMIHAFYRATKNATPLDLCDYVALPSRLFDGDEGNGEGVRLRITRVGDIFTLAYSYDSVSWQSADCMTQTLDGFADPAYPGLFMAPY